MADDKLRKMIIQSAKEFVIKEIAPIAGEIDEKESFPIETFKQLGKLGMLGISHSVQYGGHGLDFFTFATVIKEIAKVCASTAMTLVSHACLAGNPIDDFGSDSLKAEFLVPMLAGEKIGAFALTEPNAGSDITAIETSATREEDNFILNGNKCFITNANVADIFVVAAKTNPAKGALGITIFLVEKERVGLMVTGKKEKKLGMRGSDTGNVAFNGVKIPQKNMIGKRDFGIRILHNTLIAARIGMAAIATGISEGARTHCMAHVKQRKQFGKLLYEHQSIKNKLADMEMKILAANLLFEKAATLKDNNEDHSMESSIAKLFASEAATSITKEAVQIMGGYGYSREFPVERFFRDAKLTEIGDGTSEIQRLIIADGMIKRGEKRIM